MYKLVISTAAAILLSGTANALTIVSSLNGPDPGPPIDQTLLTDFSTSAGLSGSYSLVTGSVVNQYATPLGDTSQYLAVRQGQTATLAVKPGIQSLSLYWGSIDAFNVISFYNGATLIESFTGNQIPVAPADGSQGNQLNNRRVNFAFDGVPVTSVTFYTPRNAFEIDDVAVGSVPEPKTWLMLVGGFGLVGASLRRKKRTAVVAS